MAVQSAPPSVRLQRTEPTVDKINALAEGLGVDSVDVFRAASGYKTDYRSVDEQWFGHVHLRFMEKIVLNPDLTRIVKGIAEMMPREIKSILNAIEAQKKS